MLSDSIESLEFRDEVKNIKKRRSKEDIDEITFLDLEENNEEYGDLEIEHSERITPARVIPIKNAQNYNATGSSTSDNPIRQPNSVSELVEDVICESLSDFKDEHSVEAPKSVYDLVEDVICESLSDFKDEHSVEAPKSVYDLVEDVICESLSDFKDEHSVEAPKSVSELVEDVMRESLSDFKYEHSGEVVKSVSELVEGVMHESLSDFKYEPSVEVLKSSDSDGYSMDDSKVVRRASRTDQSQDVRANVGKSRGDETVKETEICNEAIAVEVQVSNYLEGAVPSMLADIPRESSDSEDGKVRGAVEDRYIASPGMNERMYSRSSFCKTAAEFIHKSVDESGGAKKQDRSQSCKDAEIIRVYPAKDEAIKRRWSSYERYARRSETPNKQQGVTVPKTRKGEVNFIARNISMVASTPLRSEEIKRRKRPQTARENRPKRDGNVRTRSAPERGNKKTFHTGKNVPSEWPILDESHLKSFRKLFSGLDQTKSGGISDKELFYAIQDLLPDEKISFEDVQKIHAEFDLKQTGEIEFDEFLFAMTHPRNYLKLIDDDDRKQLTKEIKLWEDFQNGNHKMKLEEDVIQPKDAQVQNSAPDQKQDDSNIFFTMLRTAAKKESMKEIRHFYVNKIKKRNDHVIHDWSEGQRCIGLSDQDVLRRYNHIMKELKDKQSSSAKGKLYRESPYAKPLYWGLSELKGNAKLAAGERKKSPKPERHPGSHGQPTADRKHPRPPKSPRRKGRPEQADPVKMTEKSKDAAKEQILRDKTTRVQKSGDQGKLVSKLAYEHACRAYSPTPPSDIKSLTGDKKADGKRRLAGVRSAPPRRVKISEFVVTPKVVPLPIYPIRDSSRYFDYDDLEEIRKQAATILQRYYDKLKKVSATNSKVYYKKLQVDQIRPLLRSRFKQSYLAYAGEFEPFVVSPWIPYPVPTPWIPYRPLGISCRARSA